MSRYTNTHSIYQFRRSGAPPSVLPIRDDTYDIRLQALAPGLDVHCGKTSSDYGAETY